MKNTMSKLLEENQMLRVQLLKHKLDLIVLALTPDSRRAQRIREYWQKSAGRGFNPAVTDCVIELSKVASK